MAIGYRGINEQPCPIRVASECPSGGFLMMAGDRGDDGRKPLFEIRRRLCTARALRPDAPRWRSVGNRLLTWLTNRCYGSSLTDMETCYKLIDRALLQQDRDPVSKSFDFEPENYRQDPEAGHPHSRGADPVPWTKFRRGKEDLLEGLLPGGVDASEVPLLTPIAHCVLKVRPGGSAADAVATGWPRTGLALSHARRAAAG